MSFPDIWHLLWFFSSCQNDRLLITGATWSFLVKIHCDIFILMSFFLSLYLLFSQKWGCRTMFKRFYIVVLQDFSISETYVIHCSLRPMISFMYFSKIIVISLLTILAVPMVSPEPYSCRAPNDNPHRTQNVIQLLVCSEARWTAFTATADDRPGNVWKHFLLSFYIVDISKAACKNPSSQGCVLD